MAPYNTGYSIRDEQQGTNYGHHESSNGPQTRGSYYTNLPDGRIQIVNYYVDEDSGFVAQVHLVDEKTNQSESNENI